MTGNAKESQTLIPHKSVPRWVQIIIWLFLLGLLIVLAVSLLRAQQGTIQVGEKVPDFSIRFFNGYEYEGREEIRFSELTGKVVVINFWASFCKPCETEAGILEAVWRYYQPGGEVVFLGVDWVDTELEGRSYLVKSEITFPNGPDIGTRISQIFRIGGVPETYFIDRQGVLRNIQLGPFPSENVILTIIDALLMEQ